ncbi:MAG: hypothetical protein ABIZ04_15925 [Opitutus sp.]
MKTLQNFPRKNVRRAAQAAVLLTVVFSIPIARPQTVPETTPPPKDHVLFVGTDLSVKEGGKFYHVVGATKKTLKIEKDGTFTNVGLSGGPNIRINKGVKLSNLSATIGRIKTESIDHESARAQLAAMQSSMALMDAASDDVDRKHGLMMVLSAVQSGPAPVVPGGASASITGPSVKEMQDAAAASYVNSLSDFTRSTAAATTLFNESLMPPPREDEVTLDASALPGLNLLGGSGLSDSGVGGSTSVASMRSSVPSASTEVELTFDVSSPTPLENAYIVVVANYASPSKPNEVARQISAREFALIDSHPKRVKMSHAASINRLPFKKFDMALFANGQEVATNLSEKRMALTSDQAFQFFLIDYLTAHKGATLPPAPVLMKPRAEIRRAVEKAEKNHTIYANLDKSGNVLVITSDAAGTQPLPASVQSVLQNVRFMPALEKGAPVAGRIKVTLAQLANQERREL